MAGRYHLSTTLERVWKPPFAVGNSGERIAFARRSAFVLVGSDRKSRHSSRPQPSGSRARRSTSNQTWRSAVCSGEKLWILVRLSRSPLFGVATSAPSWLAVHQSQTVRRSCSLIRARPSIIVLMIMTIAVGTPAATSAGTIRATSAGESSTSAAAAREGMRKRKRGSMKRWPDPASRPGIRRATRSSLGISNGCACT